MPAPAAPAPVPSPTPDPRLPDMTGSVLVNLEDKILFSGLSDLAGNIFLPLVGDPKVVLHLPLSRSTLLSGNILFGFEDKQGFWGTQVPSFEGTGNLSSNTLDITFADDQNLFRVVGSLSGETLNGTIYYRVRTDTDPKISFTFPNSSGGSNVQSFNYCTKITVQCIVPGNPSYTIACPNQPIVDTATPCKNFMNTTDASVKKLGTFNTIYSNWTTL